MNENKPIDLSSTLCPVDGAICDRKCGFKAHATLKRKQVIIPEDPAEAMLCEGCQ